MKIKLSVRHILLICSIFFMGACQAGFFSRSQSNQNEEPLSNYSRNWLTNQPRQIALLLPLSGNHAESAKAIQDGFFASFYSAEPKPNVRVYDTAREKDVQRVYELAIQEGADFVVGPLVKEDVYRLSTLSPRELRTPVLALNVQPDLQVPPQFIQYALAPEAEAIQIANKALEQGYRHAGIIVPDNTWGKRIANAFAATWQQQGGRIARTAYVNDNPDQSAAVRDLLGIDQSQKRANELKNLLKEKVDFQPKRRQDMDVIVMAAPPEQARQLKPLLDFYYAEDLPVFATSSVYAGTPNPRQDRDINGVIFCDMPWLLDEQQGQQLKQLLAKQGPQSEQYSRLFAMGVDAYQLISQLKRLNEGGSYMGATGQLSLEGNQIQRKLEFAKMVNGAPVRVN